MYSIIEKFRLFDIKICKKWESLDFDCGDKMENTVTKYE